MAALRAEILSLLIKILLQYRVLCRVWPLPLLALSGGSQGGEFTSAFGGVAELHGRTASAAFDANDPERSLGTLRIRPGFWPLSEREVGTDRTIKTWYRAL